MATYKVPGSGGDTFSNNLVGNQFTDGSSLMTLGNFTFNKVTPEKDSKVFITEPYGDFMTLDDVIINSDANQTISDPRPEPKITFRGKKGRADRSMFGSLKERIAVAVTNIIRTYPAAIMVDNSSPIGVNGYTAESITYDVNSDTTEFYVQNSLIYNPLSVVMVSELGGIPDLDNIRNFYLNYGHYVVVINNANYPVVAYSEPNTENRIRVKVDGRCFSGLTEYDESYLIRPNNAVVEEFYSGLDDLEGSLLNRESTPIFNAAFVIPKETNNGYKTEMVTEYVNWPTSKDGWNIQIVGLNFDYYLTRVKKLSEIVDLYKSNLIVRFLTSPQIFEFDTEDQKVRSILQLYGQSFDRVKTFIDNIANMRKVTYDGVDNLPDLLMKNLSETLGFNAVQLYDEKGLNDLLYNRSDKQYEAQSVGLNVIETEYEIYRRILTNLSHLYKSKGTRNSIEFFLKFIGAPDPVVRLDEFVYEVESPPPSNDLEGDIRSGIRGSRVVNIANYVINDSYTGYTVTQVTGTTTLTREEYPVYPNTLNPRSFTDGDVFFQKGSGWFRKTLTHRSSDVLDTENSDLESRVKVIKTKSKPFTYGEDYFDHYRTLPGLDYGYSIRSKVDNTKGRLVDDESNIVLNRKNTHIFLSGDRAIDYDIYTKSRDMSVNFGGVTPQTGVTFAEFIDGVISEVVSDSHVSRYYPSYPTLQEVFYQYQNSVGFTPYNYVTVNDFINKLGPYWVNIIEQFVPSTTLWMGGNLIENSIFNRSKYTHRIPMVTTTYVETLYPNFEVVMYEDLNNIVGGGYSDGITNTMSMDSTQLFSGVTFSVYLKINGNVYSKTTEVYKPFSGYTGGGVSCSTIAPSTDYVPLICNFELFNGGDSVGSIKTGWKNTLNELLEEINQGGNDVAVFADYYTTIDGVEEVKFTVVPNEYYGDVTIKSFEYYFLPSYITATVPCDDVRVFYYGLKSDSNVYLLTGSPTITNKDELVTAISEGKATPTPVGSINVGDVVLTVGVKPYNEMTAQQFIDSEINGFGFCYNYGSMTVSIKNTLSSIKRYVINEEFEVLPTTKILTYTNIDLGLNDVNPHFEFKYPADLYVRPSDGSRDGDVMLDQFGEVVEVTGITLNICDTVTYYGIYGVSPESTIFNGVSGGTTMVMMMIDTYVAPSPSPTPSVSTTPSPSVTPSVSITPTPSVTPSVSITPTPSVSTTPSPSVMIIVSITPMPTPTTTPGPSLTPIDPSGGVNFDVTVSWVGNMGTSSGLGGSYSVKNSLDDRMGLKLIGGYSKSDTHTFTMGFDSGGYYLDYSRIKGYLNDIEVAVEREYSYDGINWGFGVDDKTPKITDIEKDIFIRISYLT